MASTVDILIRPVEDRDREAVWSMFRDIVKRGDTYAFSPDTSREEGLAIWIDRPHVTYVAEMEGVIVGSYFVKANQPGLGSHVCNAGYMVDASVRGRGIGRLMCSHSLDVARDLGYRAMQYNFVVATNESAMHLWKSLGFHIAGTLDKAFNHRDFGFVDAHIMYRTL